MTNQEKPSPSFVLMARGNSHIRYFNAFAQQSELNVTVSDVNRAFFRPGDVRYWGIARRIDLSRYLSAHLLKKYKKFPILSRTLIWKLYEAGLRWYARIELAKFCGIIERSGADVVGVWNGQKLPSSGIAFAARALNRRVVHFENGLLPNTTTCDWQGVNCDNGLPRDAAFYRDYNDDTPLPQTLMPRAPVKTKAKGSGDSALPEKYIFVPFQVETDSQIISNSPWIKSMEQLWQHLASALDACNDPSLSIVIKEHPSEVRSYQHLYSRHPRIVFANQASTQALIEGAQAVLTVNSTVGIESLLLGKPVMVMGKACYSIPGVSVALEDERAMREAFSDIAALPFEPAVREGFLRFLYTRYCIPTAWAKADDAHFNALEARLLQTDEYSDAVRRA